MGGNTSKLFEYGVWLGEEKQGETRILRHPKIGSNELVKEPVPGVDTIWKAFEYAVNLHGNRNFLGTRKFISKDKYGEYEWKTYKEVDVMVREFSIGLMSLGLCPEVESPKDGLFKFLGIYSKNREEWIVADLAAHLNSVTVVTFYDTLGDDTIGYVLDQTKLTTIVMESKNLHKLNVLKKNNKSANLQNVILIDVEKEETVKESESVGLKVYTFPDILAAGRNKDFDFKPAQPDTIATFCYTSGTTGNPKGAMIHHGAILSDICALTYSEANIIETDIHLSYLPLAHVMERVFITACILKNVAVGFFQGNAAKIIEDAQLLKPTLFIGVPRIYQRVYEVINNGISKSGYIKKSLVDRAIKSKLDAFNRNGTLTHSVWDRLVFGKMKSSLGGNVRFMVTGSAPISGEILSFLKICFSCPIFEGYGQTENCAAATLTSALDPTSSHVGGPVAPCELKLVDCPELNYHSTDKNEEGVNVPRGEICLKGPIIFKGYFNDPDNTSKAIDKDGWLHTGDVGCVLPNGAVKILDRVKNIFKLSHGEYVAPEKLENVLLLSKYVSQMMVHGESLENYVVAIIIPKKDACIEYFHNNGKSDVTVENVVTLYEDEGLKKEILTDLEKLGRSKDFKGFEVVKKVFLTDDIFTLENGLLTPTMKLKRHEVKKKYSEQIKNMYSS